MTTIKVSEAAEAIFPGFTMNALAREKFYEIKIADLTLRQEYIEKHDCYEPDCRSKSAFAGMTLSLGSVLGGTAVMTNVHVIIGACIILGSLVSFTFALVYLHGRKYDRELEEENIPLELEKTKKAHELLQTLVPFTNEVSQFYNLWTDFYKHPVESRVQPLFEQLKKMQESRSTCGQKALLCAAHEEYKAIYPAFFHDSDPNYSLACLYLMENVCDCLKSGLLVDAWNQLKSMSMQQMVSLPSHVEPWARIGMENPAHVEVYVRFFEDAAKMKAYIYAERVQQCFKQAFTQYYAVNEFF